MKRNLSAIKKALQFGVSGAVGGFVGNLITEPFMEFDRTRHLPPWWATDTQGDMKLVEPEGTLTLIVGTKIEFGELDGEIVDN